MNRQKYDEQFDAFTAMSTAAGRLSPLQRDQVAVLDEDSPTHTGRDYCWDYLFHCAWAARQLAEIKPKRHVDFGSYVYFAALCAAFVPVEFYDIRGITFPSHWMKTGTADLTALPFPDNSLESISCLHVLEHIGLARYGDKLDASGDVKAAKELIRVLAPGGRLIMVLPMNETPRINFNAHRIYSALQVHDLFAGLKMHTHSVLFNEAVIDNMMAPQGIDYTGCMVFTK